MMYSTMAVDGLSVEQLCDTHGGITNSIGFDVWHVVRTTDNIIHFVFERQQPVWLAGGFFEQWGLPKVDQGTGMNSDDADALAFPEPGAFKGYIRAVEDAIVPRIAAMSDEYLATTQFIRPWGEIPRMEAIGHGLIGHGNGHLGRACLARTLYGLRGPPYLTRGFGGRCRERRSWGVWFIVLRCPSSHARCMHARGRCSSADAER